MKSRLIFLLVLAGGWFVLLGARLVDLQVHRHEDFAQAAERQQQRVVKLNPPRGAIYDRNGRELAVSTPADSVYAVPRTIDEPQATATALAEVLDLDAAKLAERLSSDRSFVWVDRQLEPAESRRVQELELSGIFLREESKRYYPKRSLAAAVLGFIGTDGNGLAGLEQQYDSVISGKAAERVVLRDAGGRASFDPELSQAEVEPGQNLVLTLDATIQLIAEQELTRTLEEFGAKAASAVLLDPQTGEVLAMASVPSFDPNRFGDYARERWRNRAITEVFEPGSTFKMVTAAAAIEAGVVDPNDVFDCEMGAIRLGNATIRDHKPFGLLTFREVLMRSSNIGALKAAALVGDQRLHGMARELGFGSTSGIDLPGESGGILHPLERWQRITKAYVSFGHGVSVTIVQLARAFSAVANGGELVEPYLVKKIGDRGLSRSQRGPRAMTEATARQVERMLEAVVAEGGGYRAAVEGYTVAGKTGTAQKPEAGGYSAHRRVASFVGMAPARSPLFVGAVVIDEPSTIKWGGQVAAPTFSAIARRTLLYLGAPPERERPEIWPGQTRIAQQTTPGPARGASP